MGERDGLALQVMSRRRFETRRAGRVGSIVPLPEGYAKAQSGLKSSFAALKGGLALPETTSGGSGDRAQSHHKEIGESSAWAQILRRH